MTSELTVHEQRDDSAIVAKLTPDQLAQLLDDAAVAASLLDSAKDNALSRIMCGEEVPGWALGKSQPRKRWRSPAEVMTRLKAAGLEGVTIPESMKPPGEVMQIVRRTKDADLIAWCEAMIETPPGETKLKRSKE